MRLNRDCAPPCELTWRVRRISGDSPTRPWLIYHGPDMITGLRRDPVLGAYEAGWVMQLPSGTSTHATIGDAQQYLIRLLHNVDRG